MWVYFPDSFVALKLPGGLLHHHQFDLRIGHM